MSLNIHVQYSGWIFNSSTHFSLPYLFPNVLYPHLLSLPAHTSHFPHLSLSHLTHASHPRQDALVVAFPRNLTEEKVYLIIVRVVGVRNGMSRYEPGLWRQSEEKTKRGERQTKSGNSFGHVLKPWHHVNNTLSTCLVRISLCVYRLTKLMLGCA